MTANGDGGNDGPLPDRFRYKQMGVAYQGAMESVFAIVIGVGAGYWADGYFATSPWLLAAGATIGFAAFVMRLTRLGASLNRAASSDARPEPGDESSEGGPMNGSGS